MILEPKFSDERLSFLEKVTKTAELTLPLNYLPVVLVEVLLNAISHRLCNFHSYFGSFKRTFF